MPNQNELLNEIETELFSGDMELDALDSVKVCEKCGNQPCTCHKSDKVCEKCGKIPCQCDKKQKSNNSTKENTMPLFDDPELNSLFDEHDPGKGADAGKPAQDPDVTKGEIAGAVACGKKCKSVEEDLWSKADDETETEDDGENNPAADTVNGGQATPTKKKKSGKKCKSDIADLFSDDLFKDPSEEDTEEDPKNPAPAKDDDEEDDDEDIGDESAEFDLEIASEEAAMDFDF